MMDGTLRDAAERRGVLVGAACTPSTIEQEADYGRALAAEFNCIVAENCMKFMYVEPERGRFDFAVPDRLVEFARQNRMRLRGHTLCWHVQLPAWFKEREWSRAEALGILRTHALAVVGHYRGAVFAWDVVNEALSDTGGWREDSPWYKAIGPDYLPWVFRWAHEADPQAQLFYNDYGMELPGPKADRCYRMLQDLLAQSVPVHGVGFQCHLGSENRLDRAAVSANVRRFRDLGLAVHFTEMDMGIQKPITEEARRIQAEEYANRIGIGLDAGVSAFVFWGFTDRHSWVPSFTQGEFDEALLFDRECRPKPAHEAVRRALLA
jgi:endo-1,4-beta-xylanase